MQHAEFFFGFDDAASRQRYAALAEALSGYSHTLCLRPLGTSAQGRQAARWALACSADGRSPGRRLVERLWALQDQGQDPALDRIDGLAPLRPLDDPVIGAVLADNEQAWVAAGGTTLPLLVVDGRTVG